MPEQSIIAWDLETVPDLAAAARMLDLGNAADADVRQALGPGFPKHPLHKMLFRALFPYRTGIKIAHSLFHCCEAAQRPC